MKTRTRLGWWLCCIVHTNARCQKATLVKRLQGKQAGEQDEAGRQMTWLNKRGPEIVSRSRSPFNVVFSL